MQKIGSEDHLYLTWVLGFWGFGFERESPKRTPNAVFQKEFDFYTEDFRSTI